MAKKQVNTPRSRIRSALRQLWLRSRERAKVLKDAGYRCSECDVKQTKAGKDKTKWIYLEVHHVSKIDVWGKIMDMIAKYILESEQVCLCKECHRKLHKKLKEEECEQLDRS